MKQMNKENFIMFTDAARVLDEFYFHLHKVGYLLEETIKKDSNLSYHFVGRDITILFISKFKEKILNEYFKKYISKLDEFKEIILSDFTHELTHAKKEGLITTYGFTLFRKIVCDYIKEFKSKETTTA